MARNVKTLCICLPAGQVEQLQREAKALNISVSALLRIQLAVNATAAIEEVANHAESDK